MCTAAVERNGGVKAGMDITRRTKRVSYFIVIFCCSDNDLHVCVGEYLSLQ